MTYEYPDHPGLNFTLEDAYEQSLHLWDNLYGELDEDGNMGRCYLDLAENTFEICLVDEDQHILAEGRDAVQKMIDDLALVRVNPTDSALARFGTEEEHHLAHALSTAPRPFGAGVSQKIYQGFASIQHCKPTDDFLGPEWHEFLYHDTRGNVGYAIRFQQIQP